MNLEEFFAYKNQLMKELCCNKEVVKLVTDNADSKVPNHTLAYSQIYPYEFVPETTDDGRTDGQTYICFDVDIADVANKTYYMPVMYIWIFTHKSKLRLHEGGVRLDAIAHEIDKMLNGSHLYGFGSLELRNVSRFSPINDYLGRTLVYTARDFNRDGIKPSPTNRRQHHNLDPLKR